MTQKAAIGKLAASLVLPGSCIYLDAGTTTLAIAQHLIHMESLTVVTNDFVIANYLLDNSNCTIIHTGGAGVGKTVPVSGKPLRPCCAA